MSLIEPEDLTHQVEGYAPDHWNYRRRCADVDTALVVIREQVEEWSAEDDPHGFWHRRPHLIALHNEVIRLREATSGVPDNRSYVDLTDIPPDPDPSPTRTERP